MNRESIFFHSILVAIIVVAACAPVWAAGPTKPNILFIVGDDMGYADVGFQGCKDIPTPNLDALAASGVRFTNGYVSGPYCSPTRGGLAQGGVADLSSSGPASSGSQHQPSPRR